MLHDVRLALRSLVRAPGFSATTVLTLGLAAAANAAIFAVVYGILLRPLPYREPDRLVSVWPGQFQSNADLLFTRERGSMFSSVASIAPGWTMALTGTGEPAGSRSDACRGICSTRWASSRSSGGRSRSRPRAGGRIA